MLLSGQKWIALLWAAMHASLKASDKVGWAWQVLAKSSELAPYSIPITASEIISPAPGPMMWAPSSLSVFLSAKIFTIPSVLEMALALELAKKGNTPLTYSISKFYFTITLSLEFLFSISYDGYFWVGVNDWWDSVVVDVWVLIGDVLYSKDTLFLSLVGQHGASDDISDTVNVWHIGL